MKRNLRTYDLLARLGGDEFAIILPDVTFQDAYRAARESEQRAPSLFSRSASKDDCQYRNRLLPAPSCKQCGIVVKESGCGALQGKAASEKHLLFLWPAGNA